MAGVGSGAQCQEKIQRTVGLFFDLMTDLTDFACGLVLGGILGRCRWAAMRDALLLPLPPAPPTYQGRTVRGQPLICPSPATIAECGGPCEWGFVHCDCGLLQKLNPHLKRTPNPPPSKP